MPIKGEEVQQGLKKIEREDLEKNKREKIVTIEYDLEFLVFNPTFCTSGNLLYINNSLFAPYHFSISCLDLPLWNSCPFVFHKLIVLVFYAHSTHIIIKYT